MLLVSFLVILLGMMTLIVLSHYKPWSVLESGLDPAFGIHAETTPSAPNPCLSRNGWIDFDDSDLRDQALQLLCDLLLND